MRSQRVSNIIIIYSFKYIFRKLEGNQTVLYTDQEKKDLENGNVESACGKCYLGDAFRCASCPMRGVPAFEKGDKVKLVNKDS
jgi:hypothetical protein